MKVKTTIKAGAVDPRPQQQSGQNSNHNETLVRKATRE